MKRRNFVKGLAGVTVVAATVGVNATGSPADWRRIADETNIFGPNDTLEVRLEKFNKLTGLQLTLSKPRGQKRERRFIYPGGRSTGPMDEETMMHWTAQVGLGYRIAKAQVE